MSDSKISNQIQSIQKKVNSITANDFASGKSILYSYKLRFYLWYSKYLSDSGKYNEYISNLKVFSKMKQIGFDTIRPIIFSRDNFTCMICGKKIMKTNMLNIDHIIPKSKFPSSHPWNLQTLCIPCNKNKSDELLNEIPIFLKGAKIRSTKYFTDNNFDDINRLLNYVYETNSFGEEKIIDKIINKYKDWYEIKLYLNKSVR